MTRQEFKKAYCFRTKDCRCCDNCAFAVERAEYFGTEKYRTLVCSANSDGRESRFFIVDEWTVCDRWEEKKFDKTEFDKAVSGPSAWDAVADPVAEIRKMRGDKEASNAD